MEEQDPVRMALPNGIFTLTNKVTKKTKSFRIATQPDDSKFRPGERIIYMISSPGDSARGKGFGFVSNTSRINVWYSMRSVSTERWAYLLERYASGRPPRGNLFEFSESRNCIRCNRELTHPESIELGIGPTCRGER